MASLRFSKYILLALLLPCSLAAAQSSGGNKGSGSGGCIATVSTLSSCGTKAGTIASVTDGSTSSDCTVGGGSNKNACIYSGSAWAFAGSAGSAPTFAQVLTGTNTGQTHTVGSGGTLNVASGAVIDFSALGTGTFKVPSSAGNTASATKMLAFDSTANLLHIWNGADAIYPQTLASVSHKFLTSFTQSTGVFTQSQPACADVSDATAFCNMTNTAGGDLSGSFPNPTVAKVNGNTVPSAAAAHQVLDCTGVSTCVWKTVPDCNGASNSLNYTQSTDAWSCLSISTLSNPMTTLGDVIYGGAAGAATRLAGPIATNGVTQYLTEVPAAGAATAPVWAPGGVIPNAQTGTTYTVLATDRLGYVSFSNAGAIAVTLPQSGTTGFASNFAFVACDIGAGTATITPTTSTISYSTGSAYTSAAASMQLTTGQCAWIYADNTNYFAIKYAAAAGSGAPGGVTILKKTASYTAVSGDFSSSTTAPTQTIFTLVATGQAYTLPSTAPASGACNIVENSLGSIPFLLGVVTGGATTLDGTAYTTASSSLALGPGQSAEYCSDGTNYFTAVGVGSAVNNTANKGGFWTPTITYPTVAGNNLVISGTANQNIVSQFVLPFRATISKVGVNVTTGVAATTSDIGIYDSSGNLLTHAAFNSTATNQVATALATTITLAPGTYYVAVCSTGTTVALGMEGQAGNNSSILQATQTGVQGTAANACTAGVLPATLGTITNSTSINGIPRAYWAN